MTRKPVRNFLAVAGVAGLTACSGMELQNAQSLDPQGDAFNQALYGGYVGLASGEFSEGDYRDSDEFAERAAATAGGEAPAPEALSARVLPEETVAELTTARGRLIAAMDAMAREKAPGDAAEAQVQFDCWMQEQEENFQPPHIEACRSAFYAALEKAEAAVVHETAAAPLPAAEPAFQPLSFVVYFGFDSVEIKNAGQATIERAASYAQSWPGTSLSLVGHTDRAGSDAYNDALADKRSNTVAQALSAQGIAPGSINATSRGEMELAEQTNDGDRSNLNRRVEIWVTE